MYRMLKSGAESAERSEFAGQLHDLSPCQRMHVICKMSEWTGLTAAVSLE